MFNAAIDDLAEKPIFPAVILSYATQLFFENPLFKVVRVHMTQL
jgi:hypothetical protein